MKEKRICPFCGQKTATIQKQTNELYCSTCDKAYRIHLHEGTAVQSAANDCYIGEWREEICPECFKGESYCMCPPPISEIDFCGQCGEFEDECICGFTDCCKCKEMKSFEEMAVKHSAGEFECTDCYANSIRGRGKI